MRKFLIVIIIAAAAITVYENRDKLGLGGQRLADFTQSFSQGEALEDIKKEIFTAGALGGKIDPSAAANLTVSGVIQQTNYQRSQNGQTVLKENTLLNQAAENKLNEMFELQYFEHISPAGKGPGDLAEAVHYEYITIGENLALGNYKDDQVLVQAWMDSPGHRANILNAKYTEIGVAVGKGRFEGKITWIAVQEFGKPLADCPSVNKALKGQISSEKAFLSAMEPQINGLKVDLSAEQPDSKLEAENYNQKVNQYNGLIRIYNDRLEGLKRLISDYNTQAKAYNQCVNK